MNNAVTIDFGAGCGSLVPSRASGRAGYLFAGVPVPRSRVNTPANVSHLHFERVVLFGETYDYSLPVRETVSFCGQRNARKIIRPLFHVKPHQVCGRESEAEGRFGQRAGSQGKSSDSPVIHHASGRLNLYLLSQDVPNRREHLYCQI
jgi:hypothetical protein